VWVKESVRFDQVWDDCPVREFKVIDGLAYEADGARHDGEWGDPFTPGKLRSAIAMPHWASRFTLTPETVRVCRVQDVTEDEAIRAGATPRPECCGFMGRETGWSMDWSRVGEMSAYATRPPRSKSGEWSAKAPLQETDISLCDPQMAFASFYNSKNGPDAWERNPWVMVALCKIGGVE
jgi:hypothetical protein